MSVSNEQQKPLSQDENNDWAKKVLPKYIPLMLVFLAGGAWFVYLITPLSRVNSVDIRGNNDLVAQNILDNIPVQKGTSIPDVIFDRDELEKQIIHSHPQIKQATIEVSDYQNVIIHITENRTVAFLSEDNEYRRVLETGEILKTREKHAHGNYPIISSFSEGEELNQLIEELDQLDQPILTLISEIELAPSSANSALLKVYMNSGNIVKVSINDFSDKLNYYPQMEEAVGGVEGVFDLELGAYFTPFSELDPDEWREDGGANDLSEMDDEEATSE